MILKIVETGQDATLSAATNTANYPVSNVLDSRLTRVYRTDFSTILEITLSFSDPVSISAIDLDSHNITDAAEEIKLQANTSDSWGAPAYENDLTWNEKVINDDFEEQTYKFWQLRVEDSTNPDLFIELGRLWLGEGYNTAGIKVNVTHERKSASIKEVSISGQSYLDKRYFYSIVQVRFPKLTRSQYYELIDLFEYVDIGIPFFVTWDKGGNILNTLYVTYDFDGLKLNPLGNRDLYTSGLNFIQEV